MFVIIVVTTKISYNPMAYFLLNLRSTGNLDLIHVDAKFWNSLIVNPHNILQVKLGNA